MMTHSNTNNPKFPCRTSAKNVHDKDKAVRCGICEHWIHIKCNNLNYLDYRYLQTCNEPCYCKTFPFSSLSWDKNFLACCINTDSSIILWKGQKTAEISSLLSKPTPNLELLLNQFNNATPENNNDPESNFSSKYYDMKCMLEYLTKINLCLCSI